MVLEEDVGAKAKAVAEAALEKKAEDIVAIAVTELVAYADCLLLCSGTNKKQNQAIAEEISKRLKREYSVPLGMEGYEEGSWILIDADDVIVHIFDTERRALYDLETLWHDAPRISLNLPTVAAGESASD